ncbi:MAG: hypothetical protein AB1782_08670 [Cyanobacteriota bacterium]
MVNRKDTELENIEIALLLEGIFQHYGNDFRNYAECFIKRRIKKLMQSENIKTVSSLQDKIFHEKGFIEKLLLHAGITQFKIKA